MSNETKTETKIETKIQPSIKIEIETEVVKEFNEDVYEEEGEEEEEDEYQFGDVFGFDTEPQITENFISDIKIVLFPTNNVMTKSEGKKLKRDLNGNVIRV